MLHTARHRSAALLPALAVLALGACGSSGSSGDSTATPAAEARYTAGQVAKTAGFTANPDGSWTSPTGCRVTTILLTHDEVLKERTSQDALVVTNSADDVGVKFDLKAGCREALLANLSQVK